MSGSIGLYGRVSVYPVCLSDCSGLYTVCLTPIAGTCDLPDAGGQSQPVWCVSASAVLHLLLDSLQAGGAAREPVLAALTAMLRRDSVAALLLPFSELLFRRVLDAEREPAAREVARAAEQCAGALAARLPADAVLRALGLEKA